MTHTNCRNRRKARYNHPLVLVKLALLTLLPWIGVNALAADFHCVAPGDSRYLSVDIPGKQRLCEVAVKYEATGERRVMWYADNDTTFCTNKAYELRDKYVSQWNFDCSLWPDRDGIEHLSPSQRTILDTQLKSMIAKEQQAGGAGYEITAIKAVSSTPVDGQAGMLALQYFLPTGDITQLIVDEGDSWTVIATLSNLATHIVASQPISSALIASVTDGGALEINTTLVQNSDQGSAQPCFGKQVLMVEAGNAFQPRTPHRFICQSVTADND